MGFICYLSLYPCFNSSSVADTQCCLNNCLMTIQMNGCVRVYVCVCVVFEHVDKGTFITHYKTHYPNVIQILIFLFYKCLNFLIFTKDKLQL